jgi:hypothetical protein
MRAASPGPFCGSALFTLMWLMSPQQPVAKSVTAPSPFTEASAFESVPG